MDGSYLKQLWVFFTYTGKSRSSLINFSPFQRHHYRSFNDISCTVPSNLHALPLFSSSEWPFPSSTNSGSKTPFLIYATAHRNYPQSASCTPFAFCVVAHSWLLLRLQLLHPFLASLIVLFLPFSVFCACSYTVFFCVSVLAKLSTPFFPWGGAFLYSGYTFSHYESPFPTRDGIPLVRSSLYQLVIRVKGIPVCALHCVRAATSIRIAFEVFGVDTTFSESSCVSLAHGPRWLFLLSRHRKAFLLLIRSQEICETNYQSGESQTLCFGLAT